MKLNFIQYSCFYTRNISNCSCLLLHLPLFVKLQCQLWPETFYKTKYLHPKQPGCCHAKCLESKPSQKSGILGAQFLQSLQTIVVKQILKKNLKYSKITCTIINLSPHQNMKFRKLPVIRTKKKSLTTPICCYFYPYSWDFSPNFDFYSYYDLPHPRSTPVRIKVMTNFHSCSDAFQRGQSTRNIQ